MPDSLFVPVDNPPKNADADMLGGKGFGLVWMTQNAVRVPPALIIPTNQCAVFNDNPTWFRGQLIEQLAEAKKYFTDKFGFMPLISVRSGARVSMPGMMDTILNVGLDDSTLPFWKEKLGEKCALDSYARLIEMFGSVVFGIERTKFDGLSLLARMQLFKHITGADFPNADAQIVMAIQAVFKSWENDRAKVYRKMNSIPEAWGTAVVLQAMVFGNFNDKSATGVLFTRNPDTGHNGVVGEFLINAQGEDVVAGIRTPEPLEKMKDWNPVVADELLTLASRLETLKEEVQDIEFTVQDGVLYLLQTRNAKRSSMASIKIAVDMVKEKLIKPEQALQRIKHSDFIRAHAPVIDPKFKTAPSFKGIPACNGIVTGVIVKSAEAAINCKKPCILVTQETHPDDLAGMIAAKGVLTMTGGSTSHAAVVARSMNKPCVVGLTAELALFKAGQTVSIDGATGRVWMCEVPVIVGGASKELQELTTMMSQQSGCYLIDQKYSQMIDLDGLSDKAALQAVRETLKKIKGTVVVDLTADIRDVPLTNFLNLPDRESQLAQLLWATMTSEEKARCVFLSEQTLPQDMSRLPTISDLNGLLGLNEKVFIYNGPNTQQSKRVLGWLSGEGCKPVVVGEVQKGGFVSVLQLARKLLA